MWWFHIKQRKLWLCDMCVELRTTFLCWSQDRSYFGITAKNALTQRVEHILTRHFFFVSHRKRRSILCRLLTKNVELQKCEFRPQRSKTWKKSRRFNMFLRYLMCFETTPLSVKVMLVYTRLLPHHAQWLPKAHSNILYRSFNGAVDHFTPLTIGFKIIYILGESERKVMTTSSSGTEAPWKI